MHVRLAILICLLALGGLAASCSKCDDFWGPQSCRSDAPLR
jgi:hypothetical protein